MGPFQVEAMESSARCSLASMGNKYLVELLSRALHGGEVPLQRTHNTLVFEGDATGDW